MLIYSSAEDNSELYGRVVELVDSLDSGSSVHCGRAGSSPASPTKNRQSSNEGCRFYLFTIHSSLNAKRSCLRRRKPLESQSLWPPRGIFVPLFACHTYSKLFISISVDLAGKKVGSDQLFSLLFFVTV